MYYNTYVYLMRIVSRISLRSNRCLFYRYKKIYYTKRLHNRFSARLISSAIMFYVDLQEVTWIDNYDFVLSKIYEWARVGDFKRVNLSRVLN